MSQLTSRIQVDVRMRKNFQIPTAMYNECHYHGLGACPDTADLLIELAVSFSSVSDVPCLVLHNAN